MAKYPKNYRAFQKCFPEMLNTYQQAGKLAKESGPLDAKTCHLMQLAACAALRSEGGVHSHARRAIQAGATRDELYHAAAQLVSTIGFPTAAAAFSWINDVLKKRK